MNFRTFMSRITIRTKALIGFSVIGLLILFNVAYFYITQQKISSSITALERGRYPLALVAASIEDDIKTTQKKFAEIIEEKDIELLGEALSYSENVSKLMLSFSQKFKSADLDSILHGYQSYVRSAHYALINDINNKPVDLAPLSVVFELQQKLSSFKKKHENFIARELIQINRKSQVQFWNLMGISAVFVILMSLIFVVSMQGLKSITVLGYQAKLISEGSLDRPVRVQSNDEIGALQQEFENMRVTIKEHTNNLEKTVQDLRQSNEELQQFAYVSSHDLQEPLRMVTSYMQLLSKRFSGKLDAKADKYINYAVDGAKRMQTLINDLLKYSRIGSRGEKFEQVDLNRIVKETLRNLGLQIKKNKGVVEMDDLPTVLADATQMEQLFQNLIGNGIKYCGQEAPKVRVSVTKNGSGHEFSVHDNGIGIDERYRNRIFIIFQRLHTKEEYEGTGIGLAVCKRIVERHQGKIWVESGNGRGSTFKFTLHDSIKGSHYT